MADTPNKNSTIEGVWIKQEWPISDYFGKISKIKIYTCSLCEEAVDGVSRYCPNCGARMRYKTKKDYE